jgi:hypothetical protein
MVDSDKRLFIQDIDSLVFINSIPFNLVDLLVNVVEDSWPLIFTGFEKNTLNDFNSFVNVFICFWVFFVILINLIKR